MHTYAEWLEVAAQTMDLARRELQAADEFAARNGLYVRPDLTVAAYVPDRPDAAGLIGIAQSRVDNAKRLAELSRQQVRAANEMFRKHAVESQEELRRIIDGMSAAQGGGRGGRRLGIRRQRPPRQGRRDDVDDDLTWGPEGRIRRPRPEAGVWSEGRPGHGVWTPHRPGDYGLLPGQSIRWVDGVPNLAEHGPSPLRMPGGIDPDLRGLRLTRDHGVDARMGDQALADRIGMGWTADRVRTWRLENDFVYHHYSRDELQLVPGRIHRPLAHQGSASE
jgi:hypothetical protein